MNRTYLRSIGLSLTIITLTSLSWGHTRLPLESEIAPDCVNLGYFEGTAGYGKSLDGRRIALYRAQRAAAEAGANFTIVLQLDRGLSDQGGYCLLKAYHCLTLK
ncbi:MAG TPA: hypothetical protein VIG33_06575 [Pseudobdellovibrionaceae bacterium]|jgi:hypothetical protein